jgi:hypothetical protein
MNVHRTREIGRIKRFLSNPEHEGNMVECNSDGGVVAHPVLGLGYLYLIEDEGEILLKNAEIVPKNEGHRRRLQFHFVDRNNRMPIPEHHGVWGFSSLNLQKIKDGEFAYLFPR